jgi:histidinol-phosphate aminotransferase
MHANECAEPWPESVRTALAAEIAALELNRYPDTSGRSLRALLATRHGCDPGQIVLGNGSDEVISILLTALSGNPGAKLVIPDPTFVMYEHTARVLGLEVCKVALDDELGLDEAAMRAALVGATVCFLARPNNPTSGLWSAPMIRELIDQHASTVFVVDEAYAAYTPGCTMWTPDAPENYVHMTTLSKVGLAALRVGYCIAHPELALAMNKVRHPYNVSQTSLVLAEAALTRFEDVQREMVERTIANRARLSEMLERVPDAKVYPAHGNLVLLRLPGNAHAANLHARCEAGGVLIKNVSHLPGLRGCVRVSVGTDADLDRLEGIIADLESADESR